MCVEGGCEASKTVVSRMKEDSQGGSQGKGGTEGWHAGDTVVGVNVGN